MAVSLKTTQTDSGSGTRTISVTTLSGCNYLMVGLSADGSGITGITFDGSSLTQLGTKSDPDGRVVRLYGMANPPIKTANLIVTKTAYGTTTISQWGNVLSIDTPASASGSSATATVNVSSKDGDAVVDAVVGPGSNSFTVGANQTSIGNSSSTSGAGSYELGSSTVTMSWTHTSASWGIIAANIVSIPQSGVS